MATLYRRGKTYWVAYFLPDGARVQRSLETRDRATARRKVQDVLAEVSAGGGGRVERRPLDDLLDRFEAHAATTLARKTLETNLFRLRRLVANARARGIDDITPAVIEDAMDALLHDGRSPKTANDLLSAVSSFFKWAIRHEHARTNPARAVPRRKVELPPVRFLTEAEATRVLDAAAGNPLYPMIATALYTGARFSELAYLEWQDFDWERGVVVIRSKPEHGFRTKSRKFREVPIAGALRQLLAPFRRPAGWCFPNLHGGPFKVLPRAYLAPIERASRVPGLGWHLLRHTFASWAAQHGVSLYKVQAWLGHSTPVMTQRYAHLAPGRDADIEKAFKGFAPPAPGARRASV